MRDLILDAVKGREFELACRYCGIAEGKRGDKEHHQPCPFCTGKDRFWFYPEHRTFHCRQCGFNGNLITLMMTTNAITYRQALETLSVETGILLPEKQKRTPRAPLSAIWGQNRDDARMTIACLVLVHLQFVPATDGIDFQTATIETVRQYASRLLDYRLEQIVELLAIEKYAGDRQKAWIVLECLYTGKDIAPALREYNINREIVKLRMFAMTERRKLELEIERMLNGNV